MPSTQPPHRAGPLRHWRLLLASLIVLTAVVVGSVPAWRHGLLRSMGWMLVTQDAPGKADVIVVSTDSLSVGMLEAADLVHAGLATRVALFDRPPGELQRELERRGAPTVDLNEYLIRVLRSQGVNDIVLLPPVVGTRDEGQVLRAWCVANSIHSILFVSVKDHSRRTRRVLDRALRGEGIRIMVRYASLSLFDPDSWWQTRNGQRVQIIESEKLLVDILRHPL